MHRLAKPDVLLPPPDAPSALLQVYGASDISHAAVICVTKPKLYDTVKALRGMGGSGVLVSPMTYIFDEEPKRWQALLDTLGLESDPMKSTDV